METIFDVALLQILYDSTDKLFLYSKNPHLKERLQVLHIVNPF